MKEWTCPKCEEAKPLTKLYWYENASASTGFTTSICKVCKSEYYKELNKIVKEEKIKAQAEAEFGPFCKVAMHEQLKRLDEPIPSIYKEI